MRLITLSALLALCFTAYAHADETALKGAYAAAERGAYDDAFAALRPLMESGEAGAHYLTGYLLENGFGTSRDIVAAMTHYETAARAGDADAQTAIAALILKGEHVRRDYEKAAGWLRLAVMRGHPQAQLLLGVLYRDGKLGAADPARAASLFEAAAITGVGEAQRLLGLSMLGNSAMRADREKAAYWLGQAATHGNDRAKIDLALFHQSEGDMAMATAWMRAAADNGFAEAMTGMGLLIHGGAEGEGKTAADWFERAAAAGDPQGQFLYAVALSEGDGRRMDVEVAREWLRAAMAQADRMPPETRAGAAQLYASLNSDDA